MAKYEEYCPENLTDTTIVFTVKGERTPSPTKNCLCGNQRLVESPKYQAKEKAAVLVELYQNLYDPFSCYHPSQEMLPKMHSSAIRRIR